MLSMGRASVLLMDGTTTDLDIVYNECIAIHICGKDSDFYYAPITRHGDGWKVIDRDTNLNIGKPMIRLLVKRFLDVVPLSNTRNRLIELNRFLAGSGAKSGYSGNDHALLRSLYSLIDRKLRDSNNVTIFGRKYHSAFFHPADRFVKRENRFTNRHRDFQRLCSGRNKYLKDLLQLIVNSYHINCASIMHSYPTPSGLGWSFQFADKMIIVYNSLGAPVRYIDLSKIDLNSTSLVSVKGIRNVFCAYVVEETNDTICLHLIGKNGVAKGYLCVDKSSRYEMVGTNPKTVILYSTATQEYTMKDISKTKSQAYVRLLART